MLTMEQHAERRKHLGSTDVIRILDGHARDVYLSKVYEVEQGEDSPAAALGHWLEGPLLDWFERTSGVACYREQLCGVKDRPIITVLDGLTIKDREPVNAKTSGLAWEPVAHQFGDPELGNAALPDRVISQTHIEMACVEAEVAWVPMLLPRRLRVIYRVDRVPGLAESLIDLATAFWERYVVRKVEPGPEWADVTGCDLLSPSLDILKRIKREPGSVIDVPQEPASTWLGMLEGWKLSKKEAETQVDELKSRLTSLLGDAEAGRLPDGRIIEYMPLKRRGYTVEPTTYRTLKIREG